MSSNNTNTKTAKQPNQNQTMALKQQQTFTFHLLLAVVLATTRTMNRTPALHSFIDWDSRLSYHLQMSVVRPVWQFMFCPTDCRPVPMSFVVSHVLLFFLMIINFLTARDIPKQLPAKKKKEVVVSASVVSSLFGILCNERANHEASQTVCSDWQLVSERG